MKLVEFLHSLDELVREHSGAGHILSKEMAIFLSLQKNGLEVGQSVPHVRFHTARYF
ncbi:MAG: hypothetical protein K2X08_02845 [Chlamydiales bacterium]|nr:hypothetical protein [Chlamydiales bacterium]